jgi:hypothetical protein
MFYQRNSPMDHLLHKLLYFGQLFLGLEQQLRVEISCPMINIHERMLPRHENLPSPTCPTMTPVIPVASISSFVSYTSLGRFDTGTLKSSQPKLRTTKQQDQHIPNVRRNAPRPRHKRQPRIGRILPIRPQILRLLLILGHLESQRSVRFCDGLGGCYRLFQRALAWALEFDEQRIGFSHLRVVTPKLIVACMNLPSQSSMYSK